MSKDSASRDAAYAHALERVTRQVLVMKQASDIEGLTQLVWDELKELELSFVATALCLVDEEHDQMVLHNIWGRRFIDELVGPAPGARDLGDDLYLITTQTPLSEASSRYQDAITAWRGQTVDRHPLTPSEIEELAGLVEERYGQTLDVEGYPIRFHLHVPFEYGVFTLRTDDPNPDQYSSEQVDFLRHLMEIVSIGYGRYREFLRAERGRAAQQVRAEVQAMKASDDIVGVMGLIWEELAGAGTGIDYMTISVRDPQEDVVHLQALHGGRHRDLMRAVWSSVPADHRRDILPGVDFFAYRVPGPVWDRHHTEYAGLRRVGEDRTDQYYERVKSLYGVDHWPEDLLLPFVGMVARFPGGRLNATHFHYEPEDTFSTFTPEDLGILESFAEALGLGFTRYFDFQILEQRNRELEIERAVEQVQSAVHGMKGSADIVPVMLLLSGELLRLGLEYHFCSVALVDREAGRVRIYGAVHAISDFLGERWLMMPRGHVVDSFGPDAVSRLENEEGPVYLTDIPGAGEATVQYTSGPLDSYHGRAQEIDKTIILSRTEEEAESVVPQLMKQWKLRVYPSEFWPRSVLRTPFPGGTIALSDGRRDLYSEDDARILERFAEAFSLGYARHLDFRRLEQQNRALEAANAQVKESTRRKSEFLARMSHDLRTPMNAIIGYTRILMRKTGDLLDQRQRRNLEYIQTSSESLLNLINEILDLSRVEAGRIEVKPEDVDLGRLALECAGSVESLVDPKVQLIRELANVPSIRTDPEILRKVLMNLLGNALKFTEQGSITVRVEPVEGQVELSVADTGMGIPDEDLPDIFEDFRQVERQGRPEVEGTGLGLAIAARSVELLGGSIACASEVGKGTSFTVRLGDYTRE